MHEKYSLFIKLCSFPYIHVLWSLRLFEKGWRDVWTLSESWKYFSSTIFISLLSHSLVHFLGLTTFFDPRKNFLIFPKVLWIYHLKLLFIAPFVWEEKKKSLWCNFSVGFLTNYNLTSENVCLKFFRSVLQGFFWCSFKVIFFYVLFKSLLRTLLCGR